MTERHKATEAIKLGHGGYEVRFVRAGWPDVYRCISDDAFDRLRRSNTLAVVDEFTRPQPAA